MNESNKQGNETTSVSKAHSLDEIAEYWDSHSLTDDWDTVSYTHLDVYKRQIAARAAAMRSTASDRG